VQKNEAGCQNKMLQAVCSNFIAAVRKQFAWVEGNQNLDAIADNSQRMALYNVQPGSQFNETLKSRTQHCDAIL
jgi:hypothetical protein